MLTPAQLRDDVARAFGIGGPRGPRRIGVEVEAIPMDVATDLPARIPRTLAALRVLNWRTETSSKSGAAELFHPAGGHVSFEPGGQVEFSTPPRPTGSAALADVDAALAAMRTALDAHGIQLRSAGLDPVTPIADVPLQLDGERYQRMDAHFASVGPWGRRMMRQTAALQLSIDAGPDPLQRWRLLCALVPVTTAIFANSPADSGTFTGERSIRRRIWDSLDPSRTGLPALGPDPVGEYLAFALNARAFLLGNHPHRAESFAAWIPRGATLDDWHAHLSTLFPDVRPRGFFELRAADAAAGDALPALIALICGLAWHEPSGSEALRRLPHPDAELMAQAGRLGLGHPTLAAAARTAVDLALQGCSALGPSALDAEHLARAERFFDRYTRQARSPADDWQASDLRVAVGAGREAAARIPVA